MEDIIAFGVFLVLFIGLPWLIMHHVTKWKTAPTITDEDEELLDELHYLARKLNDRLETVERIIAADNPDWRPSRITSQRELLQQSHEQRLDEFDQILDERR